MICPSSEQNNRNIASAVFGSEPLRSIAPLFESRAALMHYYASEMSLAHMPKTDKGCEFCLGQAVIEGFYVLEWSGTVKIYWVRILLFSSVFLPIVILVHLLPFAIIPHPHIRIGESVQFETSHAICHECWRNQRIRQTISFMALLITGFVLAVSFLVATIAGAVTAVCLANVWGYKSREALDPGLVFIGAAVLCVVSKMVVNRVPAMVLVPSKLKHLVKKPFGLVDAKLKSRTTIFPA